MKMLLVASLLFFSEGDPEAVPLTHEDKQIDTITREEFIEPSLGMPFINEQKIEHLIEKVNKQIYEPPINAVIDEQSQIVPPKTGNKLNNTKLYEKLLSFIYEDPSLSEIIIPTQSIPPKVDSELLTTIRTKRIGYYSTYFNVGNKERSNNIELAAKAINSHVVFPGETFSFNEVVGKRTEEKGYKRAPVIVKGELSEDVGGGICQVSSTLFNAVDSAGVHIIKRYSHSKQVPYVPPGRDATVSWYGPDFTFQNRYHQPILILTNVNNGTLVIQIFSSEDINLKTKESSN